MNRQQATKLKLPDNPGIYIFRDYQKRPLYIGRATSLRDRVKSYFSNDLIETRGPRIVDMVTKAKYLTWQETPSVLEAVILESAEIKKYQPIYNVDDRDDKSSQYVIITDEDWPRVFLVRVRDFNQQSKDNTLTYKVRECFGPFNESGLIKEALKILRRLFPFKDKKSHDLRHEAFYRAIKRSPEADTDEDRKKYLRTIKYLTLFFEGKSQAVRKLIEDEMNENAERMLFEEALKNKKLLYAIDHVNDIALIKAGSNKPDEYRKQYRIEAYDIAHISGTNVVGGMTVSENGEFTPHQYRKFKISRETNNDVAGLVEMISRRLNHSEWPYPDLIVVDGNEIQKKAAESVLQVRRINIPVVAVTKDDKHRADRLIGPIEVINKNKKEIVALNAECHRFTIAYHRKRRSRI